MNKLAYTSKEEELEQALIKLAQRSYIALMNADIEQASLWYELVQDSLEVLGTDRADREVKAIMGEYLNRTRKFGSDVVQKAREKTEEAS
ncbi:MAG: hypothetical protein AAF629_20335 [Chloroflexota bacterium]